MADPVRTGETVTLYECAACDGRGRLIGCTSCDGSGLTSTHPVRTGVEALAAKIILEYQDDPEMLSTDIARLLAEAGLLRDDEVINSLEEIGYQFRDQRDAAESSLVVERERREAAEAERDWNAADWLRLRRGLEELCDRAPYFDYAGVPFQWARAVPTHMIRSLLAGSGVSEAGSET